REGSGRHQECRSCCEPSGLEDPRQRLLCREVPERPRHRCCWHSSRGWRGRHSHPEGPESHWSLYRPSHWQPQRRRLPTLLRRPRNHRLAAPRLAHLRAGRRPPARHLHRRRRALPEGLPRAALPDQRRQTQRQDRADLGRLQLRRQHRDPAGCRQRRHGRHD
ncbi:hypothetical protein LTR16_010342, partial [Cryomyces antarcticus]